MNAFPLTGSTTVFRVEADTMGCTRIECDYVRQWNPEFAGTDCFKCQKGKLERRWHQVDVAALSGLGQCGCEHFQMHLLPALRNLPRARRLLLDKDWLDRIYRCKHIMAARTVLLRGGVEFDELLRALPAEREDGP